MQTELQEKELKDIINPSIKDLEKAMINIQKLSGDYKSKSILMFRKFMRDNPSIKENVEISLQQNEYFREVLFHIIKANFLQVAFKMDVFSYDTSIIVNDKKRVKEIVSMFQKACEEYLS